MNTNEKESTIIHCNDRMRHTFTLGNNKIILEPLFNISFVQTDHQEVYFEKSLIISSPDNDWTLDKTNCKHN